MMIGIKRSKILLVRSPQRIIQPNNFLFLFRNYSRVNDQKQRKLIPISLTNRARTHHRKYNIKNTDRHPLPVEYYNTNMKSFLSFSMFSMQLLLLTVTRNCIVVRPFWEEQTILWTTNGSHIFSLIFAMQYQNIHQITVGAYFWSIVWEWCLLRWSGGWDDWYMWLVQISNVWSRYDPDLLQSSSPTGWIPYWYPTTQILYRLPIGLLLSQYLPRMFLV